MPFHPKDLKKKTEGYHGSAQFTEAMPFPVKARNLFVPYGEALSDIQHHDRSLATGKALGVLLSIKGNQIAVIVTKTKGKVSHHKLLLTVNDSVDETVQ
jgi:hypothetical protein